MKEKLKVLSVMLMVLSLSLSAVSCSSDDDDDEIVNNSIIGTWKYKESAVGEVKTNSTVNDEKTASIITNLGKEDFGSYIYIFTADGAFTLNDSNETTPGTYTYKDGILKLMWGQPDDYDTYKVTIENGILYLCQDYTEDCNDLELDDLIKFGISDPTEYQATKAIAKITFNRE